MIASHTTMKNKKITTKQLIWIKVYLYTRIMGNVIHNVYTLIIAELLKFNIFPSIQLYKSIYNMRIV